MREGVGERGNILGIDVRITGVCIHVHIHILSSYHMQCNQVHGAWKMEAFV